MCKSGLSSTKTKFEWYTPTRHKGISCSLFSLNSFSFCCAIYHKNVQIERIWKDLPRAYICCRTEIKTSPPYHYEQIVWENSDIEWMKVPSISSTVTKYLTFELPRYFLWTIKMNCRRSLVHFSTNVMTLMLKQIHSETNIFLSNKVIWEREKRGLISYWSEWKWTSQ